MFILVELCVRAWVQNREWERKRGSKGWLPCSNIKAGVCVCASMCVYVCACGVSSSIIFWAAHVIFSVIHVFISMRCCLSVLRLETQILDGLRWTFATGKQILLSVLLLFSSFFFASHCVAFSLCAPNLFPLPCLSISRLVVFLLQSSSTILLPLLLSSCKASHNCLHIFSSCMCFKSSICPVHLFVPLLLIISSFSRIVHFIAPLRRYPGWMDMQTRVFTCGGYYCLLRKKQFNKLCQKFWDGI